MAVYRCCHQSIGSHPATIVLERQELAIKLMGLQEEERRDLARELHDEFGQCLTAINAISLSVAQGAREHCPDLVSEAGKSAKLRNTCWTASAICCAGCDRPNLTNWACKPALTA